MSRRWARVVALVLAAAIVDVAAFGTRAHGDSATRARVAWVVDGDTVRVEAGGHTITVRLIGVDTPEVADRHDPSVPPQPFACEAAAFTRRTLMGKSVRLEYESHERFDRYGRTLAYVFLDDGTFFNRELVRDGYARAYTHFPFRYRKLFRADESAARRAGRGLWGVPPTAVDLHESTIAGRKRCTGF